MQPERLPPLPEEERRLRKKNNLPAFLLAGVVIGLLGFGMNRLMTPQTAVAQEIQRLWSPLLLLITGHSRKSMPVRNNLHGRPCMQFAACHRRRYSSGLRLCRWMQLPNGSCKISFCSLFPLQKISYRRQVLHPQQHLRYRQVRAPA